MSTSIQVALSILSGALLWSFAEYGIHNWVGHLGGGRNPFSRDHLRHHTEGDFFAPLYKKLLWAAGVYLGVSAVAVWALGWLCGLTLAGAFVCTYLGYEWLHYSAHFHAPRTRYGRWVRKHHFSHHFNNSKLNHGVTSPLWDHLFGTFRAPEPVRVPPRYAMTWLLDPSTQEVAVEYAQDYVLRDTRPQAPRRASAA